MVLVLIIFNELHQNFCVRSTFKSVALSFELVAKHREVLDDAIMHQGEVATLGEMRVGIDH